LVVAQDRLKVYFVSSLLSCFLIGIQISENPKDILQNFAQFLKNRSEKSKFHGSLKRIHILLIQNIYDRVLLSIIVNIKVPFTSSISDIFCDFSFSSNTELA